MKIGILSMQRIVNYGSFWQSACLKKIVESFGNKVEFIDIKPGRQVAENIYHKSFALSKIKRIPYYIFHYKRDKIFRKEQISFLGCYDQMNYSEDYDAIFIGSDEVFNFIQCSPWGFSSQLFGNMNNSRINTYAASFGYSTYDDVINNNLEKEISSCLSKIKHISVRDQNSFDIVNRLIGSDNVFYNLDPVLVGELPIDFSITRENYILIYAYDFRFSDELFIKEIKRIANKDNLKIYCVGFYQTWCDKNIIPNPKDIFLYFSKAKYIITDTFHGSIFAMRTHSQFVTIIRKTNSNKLMDLLERTNMASRRIDSIDELESTLKTNIDYQAFEKIRNKEMQNSLKYIEKCLADE